MNVNVREHWQTAEWIRLSTDRDRLIRQRAPLRHATPRYGRARAVVGDTTAEQEQKPESEHLFQALISTPLAWTVYSLFIFTADLCIQLDTKFL